MDDLELLWEYARSGSHELFARVAQRYVDLIYSAALRQTRDPHVADDVVQAVLIILMHKAAKLKPGTILAGWLLKATRYASLDALKMSARRKRHEQEAARMRRETQSISEPPTPPWDAVAPMIDHALLKLRTADRDAVVLRYLLGKSPEQIAWAMGITEEAARQRVSRALMRLRRILDRGGIRAPDDALANMLAANAVLPASALSASAAVKIAAPGSGALSAPPSVIARGATRAMDWARAKIVASLVLAGATVGVAALFASQNRKLLEIAKPKNPTSTTRPTISVPATTRARDFDAEYARTPATLTRLMLAAARCDAPAVAHFLDAGEAVDAVSRDGNSSTAIGYAAMAATDRGYECVKLLIGRKADVNWPTGPARKTPLICAVQANSPQTVQLLLESGADKDMKDRNGRTASDWAAERHNARIQQLLGGN
jgi:RNA polymerase sigma factor (sigma-70 family)